MLTEDEIRSIEPLRYSRKITDSDGLYLLVTPKGGRAWRFNYRFDKKARTLALGCCPEVSLEWPRHRHAFARHMLAHRLDPGVLKAVLGKWAFLRLMRDWQKNEGTSAPAQL
jgi:hypothetical protein